MSNSLSRCLFRALPLVVLAWSALPAFAQEDPAALRPPNPAGIKGPVAVLVYILIAILAAAVVAAVAMPSKRGHQD